MRILKHIFILTIVMCSLFFVSCKKCKKDDDKNNNNTNNQVDKIPLDEKGNLNYSMPEQTELAKSNDDKNKIVRQITKMLLSAQNPHRADSVIEEMVNEELEYLDDESKDEMITLFEKVGITKDNINKLETLVVSNKQSFLYIFQLVDEGSKDIFDPKEFDKLISLLDSIKGILNYKQIALLSAYEISNETGFTETEDNYDVWFSIYSSEDYKIKKNDLINKYKNMTDKINLDVNNTTLFNDLYQISALCANTLYEVIDVIKNMDRTTLREGLESLYNLSVSHDYYQFIIDNKTQIKSLGKVLEQIMTKVTDEKLNYFFKGLATTLEETYFMIDYELPIYIKYEDIYKARPLINILIKYSQNEDVVNKVFDYIVKYDETSSDEDLANLALYSIELIYKGYNDLKENDKKLITEFFNNAIADTNDFTFDKLYNIVKEVLDNKEISNIDKMEMLYEQVIESFINNDHKGLIYSPRYEKTILVKKNTSGNELRSIIINNLDWSELRYCAGNAEYEWVNVYKYYIQIVSCDTSTKGFHKAVIQVNDATTEIEYYVFESLDEFELDSDYYKGSFENFIFAQNQFNKPLNVNQREHFSIRVYHKESGLKGVIRTTYNVEEVTFHNVDVSKLGVEFGYMSINDEQLGQIYIPIIYNVIPTDQNKPLGYDYLISDLSKDITVEEFCNRIQLNAIYIFATKENETDQYYTSYYKYRASQETIITPSNITKFEIKNNRLYVIINIDGYIIEDSFYLR